MANKPKHNFNPKDFYTQAQIEEVRKTVKEYKDRRRYALKSKKVTKAMLPADTTAQDLLYGFHQNKRALRSRLNELKRFTAKGKVFETDTGIKTTLYIQDLKSKQAKKALENEQNLYAKAKKGLNAEIVDRHKGRIRRLERGVDAIASRDDLRLINASIERPEYTLKKKYIGVENFKSAIQYGLDKSVLENVFDFDFDEYEKIVDENLSKLTDDEIADMMSNNNMVKRIMELYSERGNNLAFSGDSYEDLVKMFVEELPNIRKHYVGLRRAKNRA